MVNRPCGHAGFSKHYELQCLIANLYSKRSEGSIGERVLAGLSPVNATYDRDLGPPLYQVIQANADRIDSEYGS
jgi:hypothetical protein